MAMYIMSDIHGCYDKFTQMLKKINFTKEDRLIINGDIFDRGKEPLKILDYVVSNDNVIFIPGNHEYMFLEFYATGNSKSWFYNGGYTTYNQICERGQEYADSLYNWISRLDLVYVYGKFIITHAGLYLPENQNALFIGKLRIPTLAHISIIENATKYHDGDGFQPMATFSHHHFDHVPQ